MKRTGWLFLLIFTLILSSCSSSNEESASDTTKTQDVTITLTQKDPPVRRRRYNRRDSSKRPGRFPGIKSGTQVFSCSKSNFAKRYKDTNKPSAKANFIRVLPRRQNSCTVWKKEWDVR